MWVAMRFSAVIFRLLWGHSCGSGVESVWDVRWVVSELVLGQLGRRWGRSVIVLGPSWVALSIRIFGSAKSSLQKLVKRATWVA